MKLLTIAVLSLLSVGLPSAVVASSKNSIRGGSPVVIGSKTINHVLHNSRHRRLDSDDDEPEERECEFSYGTTEVEFRCKEEVETDVMESEDEIEYKIELTYEGIKIKVEYNNEVEMEETETESETQFEILFYQLIEYFNDPEGDTDAYDWGVRDQVVGDPIALNACSDFSEITDDGVTAHFNTVCSLGMAEEAGSATFNFTVSRATLSELITANSIKIDVIIEDFLYSTDEDYADEFTYLALLTDVVSVREVEIETDDGGKIEEEVFISFGEALGDTGGATPFGSYTWEREAIAARSANATNETAVERDAAGEVDFVEETTIEVIATSPGLVGTEDNNMEQIAFSFIGVSKPSYIYWDPQAGISYGSSSSAATHILSFAAVLGGALGALLLM